MAQSVSGGGSSENKYKANTEKLKKALVVEDI